MNTIPYEHHPEWTSLRMDTIPNGHNPEKHNPEWTQHPEWTHPFRMGTPILNGRDPEWKQSRMDTFPNVHLHSYSYFGVM